MTKEQKKISFDDKPCWRKNGVWGDETPRCEKLLFVNHCRNCSIFETAAKAAIFENEQTHSTVGQPGEALSIDDLIQKQRLEGDQSILPFRLGRYCLAVPTRSVVTINDHVPIHGVPFNHNPIIKGVVAINHEIYTFVNFSELLSITNENDKHIDNNDGDKEKNMRGLYKRILVINFNSRILSFYVDEVFNIYRYYQQAVGSEIPYDFFADVSNESLLKENEWNDDCYILNLEKISEKFEGSFI